MTRPGEAREPAWTAREIAIVRRFAKHGSAHIARALGRTPSAVRRRAQMHKIQLGDRPGRTCGLISTYNAGCRCDDCRRAARERRAHYRRVARYRARYQTGQVA